jgi:prophage maintenance system killer protein
MINKIEIFKSSDNKTHIEVRFDEETVWLTQKQISDLFERERTVITKHIRNIFKEEELSKDSACAFFAHTADDGKTYDTQYYNLDMIISVGYRVNSKRGTQFRQWATQRLKDYLIQGYTINEIRLEQKQQQIEYLKTGLRIFSRAIEEQSVTNENEILGIFAKGLGLLDDFDHEKLDQKGNTYTTVIYPKIDEYLGIITRMKPGFASEIFAIPKDKSFESSIKQIEQCFDGIDLYPSLEEKATTLLYLIVKNHSFIDGNKRIGAACFLHFLEKNNLLFKENKEPVISNEALAALTIFVASSNPNEMEIVKKLIISILNRR